MARPHTPLPRDQAFKAILSHPRMIADALRGYAARPIGPLDPRTVGALDFNTLEKLPTEWITRDFRRRLGDQVWRVRFRWARDWSDPGGYLLILVEFQSRRDADMALRFATYALQLYAELETAGVVRAGAPRPSILPLLIHNGPGRWTAATSLDGLIAPPAVPAAVVRQEDIEDARLAAADLAPFQLRHAKCSVAGKTSRQRVCRRPSARRRREGVSGILQGAATKRADACARALRVAAGSPAAALRPLEVRPVRLRRRALLRNFPLPLTRRFACDRALCPLDFRRHREDDPRADNAMSVLISLETAAALGDLLPPLQLLRGLPERDLAGWMLAWALRRLDVDDETAEELREMASLDEFRSQLEETAKGWTEDLLAQGRAEGIEQGIEQGIERGRAEGVAAQRAALRQQASLRFGASVVRLDPLLDEVDSSTRLAEIGRWLMVDTIDELVAKIEAAGAGGRLH